MGYDSADNATPKARPRLPDFILETQAGAFERPVAGVDEAGRGPWAGPVVAAAVILDPARLPHGLNDSKKLSSATRARLYDEIRTCAEVGVGVMDVDVIDSRNILRATLDAMTQALRALPRAPSLALIDGNRAPDVGACATQCVVRGDGRSLSIAAASIVAKVTRDRMMAALAEQYPGYGWERNMGYGTAAHRAALIRLGVTDHHRRSFAPIRKMLSPA